MAYDAAQMLEMTQPQLDDLFRASPAGAIPNGEAVGTAIIASVYAGPSWMDGKDCVVLDYSQTSMLAHWIRDEIRLVSPNFYLGKVYWGKDRLIDFCLQF